jgi:quercetin dioxygenase-like cupin family protein
MTIRLQLDRIPPGTEIGPHRHGVETIVYVAGGEIVFEHGEDLERRVNVPAGDVLFEAPAEWHLVRNEGSVDALALIAATEPNPRQPGLMLQRWEYAEEPVNRRDDAAVVEIGDIRRRLIVEPGDFGSATFTISEIELGPGASTEWHRHPDAEHAIVIFEGRGYVRVGTVEETLEPLKGIRVAPGLSHQIENTGRTVLRYYVCASPGTDPLVDRKRARAPKRRLDA